MFCKYCGKEIRDGSKFCIYCGGNLAGSAGQLPEAGTKGELRKTKLSIKWVLSAAIVAALTFGVGGVAVNYCFHQFEAGGKQAEKPEIEIGQGKHLGKKQETEEEIPATAKEKLENYLKQDLMKSMGQVDLEQEYYASYERSQSSLQAGYVQGISGLLTSDIRDYDKDGTEELLLLMLKEGTDENNLKCQEIWFQMYEYDPEGIILAAEEKVQYGKMGGIDEKTIAIYRKEGEKTIYLAEQDWEKACLIGDGIGEVLRVLHYEDHKFVIDTMQEFKGSSFWGEENDQVAQTASDLEQLGFTKSARMLDYSLQFQNEEDMESFFALHGENPDVYNYDGSEAGIVTYNSDASQCGKVVYRFYSGIEQFWLQNGVENYEVVKDDFSMSEGPKKVTNYFERIVFYGKNEDNIIWLNRQIEDLEKEHIMEQGEVEENLQWLFGFDVESEAELFNKNDVSSVYMDEKGNISVAYHTDWWMGGVCNDGYCALNCNIMGKHMLTLEQVLGVDYETAQNMIRDAMWEQKNYDYDEGRGTYQAFYFDEDTVTVCLDAHFYGSNGMADTLVLKRKNGN